MGRTARDGASRPIPTTREGPAMRRFDAPLFPLSESGGGPGARRAAA
ncbi:hypothetical protein [Streptomyces sp. NPDC086777]